MRRFILILAGLMGALGLFGVERATATTVEATDFDRLLDQAQEVYKAQVIAVTYDWSGEGVNRHIATFVRLRVLESMRGALAGEQTLEFLGGTMGDRTQRIVGMPEFHAGDVEILFVRGNHTELCPLVGMQQGRFRVVKNAADGREQIYFHNGAALTDVAIVGKPSLQARAGAVAVTDATGAPVRALSTEMFTAKIRAGLVARGIASDQP